MNRQILLLLAACLMQFSLRADHSAAATATVLASDDCASATDLTNLLGGDVDTPVSSAMFSNVGATIDASDPTSGWECWGEPDGLGGDPSLDNSQWVTFIGDGSIYSILTTDCGGTVTDYIDAGDTQIAIYTGADCENLTPVSCNEDVVGTVQEGPYPAGLDLLTEAGVKYYILIDGFAGVDGEYCIQFTRIDPVIIPCDDIALGLASEVKPLVCLGDSTAFDLAEGTVIPSLIGEANGFSWLVSSADISGSADPFSEMSYLGNFAAITDPADIYTPQLPNVGMPLQAGVYFFTPVVFGGGTGVFPDLDLTNGCIVTGNSIETTLLGVTADITASFEVTNVTSAGNDGEASVTAAGGTGNYSYLWNANGEATAAITGLAAGVYACTISDVPGCTDDLVVDNIEVKDLTAIDELGFAQAFGLFPNPANKMTTIQFNFSETVDLSISVSNAIGEVVYRGVLNQAKAGVAELDLSNFASGVYFIELSEGRNKITKRLVVEK